MVGSDDESKESDGHHSSDHSYVAERLFFTRVVGYDMGDYPEPGQDENVDFGVAEESEQVLVKDWVPTACGVEKGCVKISVRQEHGNSGS